MEEERVESSKRRIEVRQTIDVWTDFEKLQDQIDTIVDDDIVILKNPSSAFSPKLTMFTLRPFLTGLVLRGMKTLRTSAMKLTIAAAFDNDGLLACMISPEVCRPIGRYRSS